MPAYSWLLSELLKHFDRDDFPAAEDRNQFYAAFFEKHGQPAPFPQGLLDETRSLLKALKDHDFPTWVVADNLADVFNRVMWMAEELPRSRLYELAAGEKDDFGTEELTADRLRRINFVMADKIRKMRRERNYLEGMVNWLVGTADGAVEKTTEESPREATTNWRDEEKQRLLVEEMKATLAEVRRGADCLLARIRKREEDLEESRREQKKLEEEVGRLWEQIAANDADGKRGSKREEGGGDGTSRENDSRWRGIRKGEGEHRSPGEDRPGIHGRGLEERRRRGSLATEEQKKDEEKQYL